LGIVLYLSTLNMTVKKVNSRRGKKSKGAWDFLPTEKRLVVSRSVQKNTKGKVTSLGYTIVTQKECLSAIRGVQGWT